MLFHKIALELGVENVETFGCRVNKKGIFYMLNTGSDVLNFLNGLKGVYFVDVYVVHSISIPLVVEEILVLSNTNVDVSSSLQKDNVDVSSSLHKYRVDLSSSPQIDRVDVSSSQPFDENENRHLNQNQSPLVEKQSNIQEQVKEKADRVNLDEISSGPVGIDADFEDIYKEKRGRFKGNLGGDNPYFDSSDPDSDISEDEGDPIENDEVVDPTPRKECTKIYFDPTAKKILFQLYMGLHLALIDVLPNAKIRWCARHIWVNWKKEWKGEERRRKFWQVSNASFEVLLQSKLDDLSELGEGIIEALLKYNKEAWCRTYFKEHSKCDVVENKMCETFNSWTLGARFKSIITMLEEIRVKVIERMNQKRDFSEKWIIDVSPMAIDILRKMLKLQIIVRSWQLKGIPCGHALITIHYKDWIVESFVDH
ncbi:hypothetical protein H5410_060537 [Solanum commersonii]|uniref:Uncharacterized protein n=1 Tax=Solanum commersonii TaxID=4109 RepID=A0A9J5W5B6_SOLCO|nr:hypothetical protein H5410_060537 [Solanum commersonii]